MALKFTTGHGMRPKLLTGYGIRLNFLTGYGIRTPIGAPSSKLPFSFISYKKPAKWRFPTELVGALLHHSHCANKVFPLLANVNLAIS